MKSAIYTANTTQVTALPSGSTIPLGTIVRRFGCNINLGGNGIMLKGQGYYDIKANVVFTPTSTTAEVYTIDILKDGVPIEGARSSINASTRVTLPAHALVRLGCCDTTSVVTIAITATTSTNTVTLNDASVIVEKL